SEFRIFAFAHGPVERNGILRDLEDPLRLLERDARRLRDLLERRLPAVLLGQLAGHLPDLRHRLDHVDRDPDGPGLVGDGARDGLADPPGGVRAELVAAAILVLLDGLHQAGVPFLDEIQETQAAVPVPLPDRDHQPEVPARQLALGVFIVVETLADVPDPRAEIIRPFERLSLRLLELLLEPRPGGTSSPRGLG